MTKVNIYTQTLSFFHNLSQPLTTKDVNPLKFSKNSFSNLAKTYVVHLNRSKPIQVIFLTLNWTELALIQGFQI